MGLPAKAAESWSGQTNRLDPAGFWHDALREALAGRKARLQNCGLPTELSDVESYSEPAVLWRLRHPEGDQARATLIPGSPTSTLVFFVNGLFDRGENFAEWTQAIARADQVRRGLLEQGWTVDG